MSDVNNVSAGKPKIGGSLRSADWNRAAERCNDTT